MADPVRPSYRLNLNRNPTRKWAEAQQVDYDGDDWGEEDYNDYGPPEPEPVSAGAQRHPGWGQGVGSYPPRSFTNPVQSMQPGRSSFDRGDDHRYFSAGGFDPRYPIQPTSTHMDQHTQPEHVQRDQDNLPSLQLDTQAPGPSAHSAALSKSRPDLNIDAYGAPRSAPVSYPSQRSQPGAEVRMAGRVGHEQAQEHYIQGPDESVDAKKDLPAQSHFPPSDLDAKPLPFIRPADIYKRVEEEREKERRSQDSSRPSVDSGNGRVSSSPHESHDTALSKQPQPPLEDIDVGRRAKSPLDTVAEQRNERGLSPVSSHSSHPLDVLSDTDPASAYSAMPEEGAAYGDSQRPQMGSRSSSSIYTDRPDPVSATTPGSELPPVFASGRSPIAERYQRNLLRYSPSARKPSGLQQDSETGQTAGDLPNFDHAVSPSHSMTSLTFREVQDESQRPKSEIDTSRQQANLQHQPSLGYRSAVHQAFDASNNSMLSPSGPGTGFARSSSTSASEISPIMSRKPDPSRDSAQNRALRTETVNPTIPEESDYDAAVQASESHTDIAALPATNLVPGFRRDNHPPNTEESRARRPLSVEVPDVPEAQAGVLSSVSTTSTLKPESTVETLPATQYTAVRGRDSPSKQLTTRSDLAPPATSRTASEDYHQWQDQRREFNEKHGIEDSSTASPAVSSPISRSESPAKGTVRDIAERLETSKGRSSPIITDPSGQQAPGPNAPSQTRNEGFRPTLPGGWLSYTTNASSTDNIDKSVKSAQPPQFASPSQPSQLSQPVRNVPPMLTSEQNRTESTDSIPTATAPRNWQPSQPGSVAAHFAAAAAAGNAMAGAFSGPSLSNDTSLSSESLSEDESSSEASQSRPPEFSETRDFATTSPESHTQPLVASEALPSLQVSEKNVSSGAASSNEQSVDFPAPLRTSKTNEARQPSPRLSIPVFPSGSNQDDSEKLQHEIVESLTPRASSIENNIPKTMETLPNPTESSPKLPRQSSTTSENSDILPQEYSSYWDEGPAQFKLNDHTRGVTANDRTNNATVPPPIPATSSAISGTAVSDRPPFLEQRYSWETNNDKPKQHGGPPTSDFERGVSVEKAAVPSQAIVSPPGIISPPTPNVQKAEPETPTMSPNRDHSIFSQQAKPVAMSSFPEVRTDFKRIIANPDASQRIRAFEENRQMYAQPSGLLEQWISSMNTQEHEEVFRSSRLPRPQPTIMPGDARPSPGRDTTPATGTKLMQEDGRRLLAAAGKYGGKASTVAKGFFSKQKDKLRTAGSSDKGHSRRRSSSTIEINTSTVPSTQELVLPERAPQLPTPALETPPEEKPWFDQIISDKSQPSSNYPVGLNTSPTTPKARLPTADKPPASVVASIPGEKAATAKPQAFPNYGVGTETERDMVGSRTSRHLDQGPPQLSGDRDGFAAPPRVDSLPVPHQRRPSTISDVSEISVVPDETNDVVPRNVSPALETQSRNPKGSNHLARASEKEDELQKDTTGTSGGTLPAYGSTNDGEGVAKLPKVAPGAQIVPVADLKTAESRPIRQSGSRPFSFVGSETLIRPNSQQGNLHSRPDTAQQPPNVGIPADIAKTPQPIITEHPAFRADESTLVTENPLPSSRRDPQDLEHARQRQQVVQAPRDQDEGGYRIPGPYVRELRSPRTSKPTLEQVPSQGSHENLQRPASVQQTSQERFPVQSNDLGRMETLSQIESRPEPKKRGFSGIFRTRSRSQNRRQQQETSSTSMQGSEFATDEGRKRRTFFSPGPHQPNPARKANDGMGGYASPQDAGRSRKPSMDMFRSTPSANKPQSDNKKKRSSAIGAFFSKSMGRDREETRPGRETPTLSGHNSQQSLGAYGQPNPNHMQQNFSSVDQSYGVSRTGQSMNPNHPNYPQHPQYPMHPHQPPISQQAQFSQYAQSPQDPQYPHHPNAVGGRYGAPGTSFPEDRGRHMTDEQVPNYVNQAVGNNWYNPDHKPRIYEDPSTSAIAATSRPQDGYSLSEETPPAPVSAPYVPVTHAGRDISYGAENTFQPPTSPIPTSAMSPTESKGDGVDHVKNLHKRSRSPRLGRPPSDEHLHADNVASSPTGQPVPADPANRLGVFDNKKISPDGRLARSDEEQETPWKIGLPNETEEDNRKDALVARDPNVGSDRFSTAKATTGSSVIPPTSAYQQSQRAGIASTTSPVTAVEPRHHRITATASSMTGPEFGRETGQPRPQRESMIATERDSVADAGTVEHIDVPPTISSAAQIPDPLRHAQEDPSAKVAQDTSPSVQSYIPPSSAAPRNMKSAGTGRTSADGQGKDGPSSKPLTVADQILAERAARGTTSGHRSTTTVSKPVEPSTSIEAKPTTGTEERPSTIGPTTMSNTGTTVTTTTMTSGSKHAKPGLKTSTYVVDSNTPSRASSNAVSNGNRLSSSNPLGGAGNSKAPLTTAAVNSSTSREAPGPGAAKALATGSGSRKSGKTFEAVELPGSRPDGYESEEEIVMSATAYPGQEWMPDYAIGASWDD